MIWRSLPVRPAKSVGLSREDARRCHGLLDLPRNTPTPLCCADPRDKAKRFRRSSGSGVSSAMPLTQSTRDRTRLSLPPWRTLPAPRTRDSAEYFPQTAQTSQVPGVALSHLNTVFSARVGGVATLGAGAALLALLESIEP